MEIKPNTPSMNYNVLGFPMSTEDAFALLARSLNFDDLDTDAKTIISAINELVASADDFVENVNETTVNTLTTTNKTVSGSINETYDLAMDNKGDISDINEELRYIDLDIEEIKSHIKPELTLSEVTYTNPAYFTGDAEPVIVNDDYVAISYTADVEQDIQYSDGELEVININLRQTATLDLTNGMPANFYIPARVTYFDSNGDFVKNVTTLLEARWEQGQNSYDISIYLHDVIDNTGSTTRPKLAFSGIIPYVAMNVTP